MGRLALQLPKTWRPLRAVFGKGNTPVTLSETMTCVRRAIGDPGCCHTPADRQAVSTRSRALQDTRLYALAPAASGLWPRRLRRSRCTPMPHRRAKVELRGNS
jgi:hypothetical protein